MPVPGPGEIVVRVAAALTCGTDLKVYRRGYHAMMLQPPIPFGLTRLMFTAPATPGGATTVIVLSSMMGGGRSSGGGGFSDGGGFTGGGGSSGGGGASGSW